MNENNKAVIMVWAFKVICDSILEDVVVSSKGHNMLYVHWCKN